MAETLKLTGCIDSQTSPLLPVFHSFLLLQEDSAAAVAAEALDGFHDV